jgi:hypothetical protein
MNVPHIKKKNKSNVIILLAIGTLGVLAGIASMSYFPSAKIESMLLLAVGLIVSTACLRDLFPVQTKVILSTLRILNNLLVFINLINRTIKIFSKKNKKGKKD